jgi:hypothetical protein
MPRRLLVFVLFVLGLLVSTIASAATTAYAGTRVGAFDVAVHVGVGLSVDQASEKHRRIGFTCDEIASGSPHAAEGIGTAEGALGKMATSAPEQFFVENGVRRSLAVREPGLTDIPATIYRPGQAPVNTTLRLDQLFSPKTSVPMDSRFLRIQPPIPNPDPSAAARRTGPACIDPHLASAPRTMSAPTDLERRLLFVLHRGLVESRLLAQAGKQQQMFDLADALEPLPGWLASWKDEHLDAVRENLRVYAGKYPEAFRYLDFIDNYDPPPF